MGQINQPSNLLDRIKRAERELGRLWKAVGLASATISRGGLTLLQDAFLRMVDDNGDEIVYIGPDANGKQIMRIRREGGNLMLYTAGSHQFGRDYWALTDSTGRVIFSDDAEVGVGMARPWLPVVLYPKFTTHTYSSDPGLGETYSYMNIDTGRLSGETVLWEGFASITHPWLSIDGVWGRAVGDSVSATYRLKIDETTVDTWTESRGAVHSRRPRTDVSQWIGQDWVRVTVTASASGSGAIACQLLAAYLL